MSRPYLDINSFRSHCFRRAGRLQTIYSDQKWRTSTSKSLILGSLVLELDNLVIQSLRGYALSKIWEYQSKGSLQKPPGRYMSNLEYSAEVIRVLKPKQFRKGKFTRDDETAIRDPMELRRIFTGVLGVVPLEFSNAIALNGQVFYEMKLLRHFYAHRCEDTMIKLSTKIPIMNSGLIKHPDDYVDRILPGQTSTKYTTWWNEYCDFFAVA